MTEDQAAEFAPAAAELQPPTLNYGARQRSLPRWLRWTLWILLVAGLICLFYPHGFNRGSITLTCTQCQGQTVYKRIEAIPPRWLFFERYAGWTWHEAGASTKLAEDCDHVWGVNVQAADMRMGRVTGSGTPDHPADLIYINGIVARPDNARQILDALMAPGNNGVSFVPPRSAEMSDGSEDP